jgi:YegS/Rv2252/BmrU family lipid kinase
MPETIVILNPAAKSERAAELVTQIEALAGDGVTIRLTAGSGDARAIARQAVEAGYRQIVAAGGDGTINEVVNGMAGSEAALGILPIGSMNVFAAELGLPKTLRACWETIRTGHTRAIDLPEANGRSFVQLAGVGLDAQIVQETSWDAKRDFGPLSYLFSAAQIAGRQPPRLRVEHEQGAVEGSFVLIGNGRFYGGPFAVFPDARVDDGLLDVLVFEKQSYFDIFRYLHGILFGIHRELHDVTFFRADRLSVTSETAVPLEVDGEVCGTVPVTFQVHPRRLHVLAPSIA